ncbi:ABC transporter substrate-binding protein [Rhizobium binxianense]
MQPEGGVPFGPGSVIAAQIAIKEFGGKVNGTKIELSTADSQNRPDVGPSGRQPVPLPPTTHLLQSSSRNACKGDEPFK